MQIRSVNNILEAVRTINRVCKEVTHNCALCPLGYEAPSGAWKCSICKDKWHLEEHLRSKQLPHNIPSTWSDGRSLHIWSTTRESEDETDVHAKNVGVSTTEDILVTLKNILACATCFFLGQLWCQLRFVRVVYEQNIWPKEFFAIAFIMCIFAAIVAIWGVANQLWHNRHILNCTICASICYVFLKLALFHSTEFMLEQEILAIFIVAFSMLITFSVVHISLSMLWHWHDHFFRLLSYIAGLFVSVYISQQTLVVTNEHAFLTQGIAWIIIVVLLALQHNGTNYGYEYEK